MLGSHVIFQSRHGFLHVAVKVRQTSINGILQRCPMVTHELELSLSDDTRHVVFGYIEVLVIFNVIDISCPRQRKHQLLHAHGIVHVGFRPLR